MSKFVAVVMVVVIFPGNHEIFVVFDPVLWLQSWRHGTNWLVLFFVLQTMVVCTDVSMCPKLSLSEFLLVYFILFFFLSFSSFLPSFLPLFLLSLTATNRGSNSSLLGCSNSSPWLRMYSKGLVLAKEKFSPLPPLPLHFQWGNLQTLVMSFLIQASFFT